MACEPNPANCLFCQLSFIGAQPRPFVYMVSMVSSCSTPSKPEIYTVWLFTEKIANSCSRRMLFLKKKKAKYISKRISYYGFKLDIPRAIDATEGVTVQEHFFIQTASFTFSGFS